MTRTLLNRSRRHVATTWPTSVLAILGLALAGVALLNAYGSDYVTTVAVGVATYAVLGLGLNVVMGYAGLLDMGYAAFFAIGAYTSAICGVHLGLDFFASIPIAIAVTALAGVLIGYPTLRLRPDYLAIVTIGFGELVRTIANNWDYVGASRGLYPLPIPELFGFTFHSPIRQALLAFALLAVAVVLVNRLGRSHIGRAWRAIRDDDFVTESVGLPTLRLKIGAYVAGGAVGALAGSIFAARSVAIDPTNFELMLSVQLIMVVVLGGLGSTVGVLGASLVFVALPEILRSIQDYRLLVFSVAVIILIELRPRGLVPERSVLPPAAALAAARTTPATTTSPPSAAATQATTATPEEPAPLLRATGITKRFAGLVALDDVSLTVEAGRVVGIIGPNGAGKSTLINAITGVHRATSGRVELRGRDITRLAPHRIARLGVSRTFQTTRLIDQMAVLDNVTVAAYATTDLGLRHALFAPRTVRHRDFTAAVRAWHQLDQVGLTEAAARRPGSLSYADRRRVELARAMIMEPSLLILDEPAAGMNPKEKADLTRLLRTVAASGVAVLLIEHDMPLVTAAADEVVVLDQGRILATGAPTEVLALPEVIEAYLGHPTDDEEPDR
ncbi:branched-chain amino acid ABC transporter ATP-binding protein/permease [Micromonospora sp. HNM0581]|uniref:branched-chain amino acid ABC transporter ATP-binding protein/permease n=1 Tax=Micromonospora sp. HNM0581 TaxID=2716341 RepID=UPI00146D53DB|nr:branched-chain amino acid ABC transporter ATP-binding protein/permease [Micromonospora sp. HNM0581]NLU78501.1 branched-chain amino acid ABC transporter ATP-binding protein/permease [Micromonospora sp. HNM0581]